MDYLIKSVEELANPTCLIDAEKLKQCGLTGIVLREYQLQGINWLANCDSQKHGGLLCDEMGLGKTCQVCIMCLSHSMVAGYLFHFSYQERETGCYIFNCLSTICYRKLEV
ncbi:unnamed protein product [Trichobilharzia regenti]|nr:unnamed protein product [Trichobilharzia regenti]